MSACIISIFVHFFTSYVLQCSVSVKFIYRAQEIPCHSIFIDKMTLQRYFFHISKQYTTRCLQSNLKQCYCVPRHKYSSGPRKYTDRHEWVIVHQGTGTVGISNYAQESLGDVVFAQLPDPGANLKAGDECGALESVKAASEIYSPVSGTVTVKNVDVEAKPALINSSCYDQGWLFKLKLSDLEELDKLMTEKEYETFLKTDEKEHV